MSKKIYFEYLELLQQINDDLEWPKELDPSSMLMLEIIVVMHEQAKTLTVGQAMKMSSLASPSWIHRKLLELYELGLIDYIFLEKNRRTKYLQPTHKTERYFTLLGEALRKSQENILLRNTSFLEELRKSKKEQEVAFLPLTLK